METVMKRTAAIVLCTTMLTGLFVLNIYPSVSSEPSTSCIEVTMNNMENIIQFRIEGTTYCEAQISILDSKSNTVVYEKEIKLMNERTIFDMDQSMFEVGEYSIHVIADSFKCSGNFTIY